MNVSYISGFPSLRRCVLQVIILGLIILTSIEWYILRLQKPMPLFPLPREEAGAPPLLPCKCAMKSWPGDSDIADQLHLSLSWLNNITTYQELQERHPNLPLDLLHGAKNKRCSLLPTLFRYGQRMTVSLLPMRLKVYLSKGLVHIIHSTFII